MICPLCASTEITVACCGDSSCTCRTCGLKWDTGVPAPCPVPNVPTKVLDVVTLAVEPYRPLTRDELWGE